MGGILMFNKIKSLMASGFQSIFFIDPQFSLGNSRN
jgi:hypothetical protein